MSNKYRQTQSTLQVSEEAIATVARCAAKEIPGVASLTSKNLNWKTLLLHGRIPRSIYVDILDSAAYVDLNIVIRYGYRATDIGKEVQSAVRNAIVSMTGIRVARVNVHIADISFED